MFTVILFFGLLVALGVVLICFSSPCARPFAAFVILEEAIAASGGSLFARIRRLAAKEQDRHTRSGWIRATAAVLLMTGVGAVGVSYAETGGGESPQEQIAELDESVSSSSRGPSPVAGQPVPSELPFLPADGVVLDHEREVVFLEMELEDPDVIHITRHLFQHPSRVSAAEASKGIRWLASGNGEEGMRAVAGLFAAPYGYVRECAVYSLSGRREYVELLLQSGLAHWQYLHVKAKCALGNGLRRVMRAQEQDERLRPLVEEMLARMIRDKGHQVPLMGLQCARELAADSDVVRAAAETLRSDGEYDYFENVHPVRKAALEFLGEEYVPPARESFDYAGISIVEEKGLTPSDGLTVGVLASLYTAEGPCAGGGNSYGWNSQYRGLAAAEEADEAVLLLHPITEVDSTRIRKRLEDRNRPPVVLNAASLVDLAYCDVVTLSSLHNLRAEVVDALEAYVWNGGGLVEIDGAGIIACNSERKLAWLQDMTGLNWSWNKIKGQSLVATVDTPITRGLDLSGVLQATAFNRNGYRFSDKRFPGQVLLRFDPDGAPALRVSTYGKGRIVNLGWAMQVSRSPQSLALARRCMAWAAGRFHPDYFPEPLYSRERWPGATPPLQATTSPAPLDLLKAKQETVTRYAAAHPEIKEYILWTARQFGRSAMWLNEDAFAGMPGAEREKKVQYLAALLSDSEYGRHLCRGLAEASALKDERLVSGLIKVAGYQRDSGDYDCRAKWIAVSALARQESDQAVPLLISLVDHGNQNTRKWARAALARKTGQDFKEDKLAWAKWWKSQGHAAVDKSLLLKWGKKESAKPEQVRDGARKAVKTIATCAETDPRVKESLDALKGLDEKVVIDEMASFLDSKRTTIRRAAIYVLWKGEFTDIAGAAEGLMTLCSHEEEYTRGMAALCLGQNKVAASFDTLVDMTRDDKSGYARRCGAYALGLLGDPKARPVLKEALKDSDSNVRNHAESALVMLSGAEKEGVSTPDFSDVEWETVTSATFDDDDPGGTRFIWKMPGVTWDITNGTARARGTPTKDDWTGTRVVLPVTGDDAELVEISGEFKLVKSEGYHLTALFGADKVDSGEPLCMFFEGRGGRGHYRIQTRWMEHPSELVAGSSRTAGFGDEAERFHKMRMILDRSASMIHYFADDRHLGSVKVNGEIVPLQEIKMDFESNKAGDAAEILYDNLTVRSGKWNKL